MHALFSALLRRGWVVRFSTAEQPLLPAAIELRYRSLPSEVAALLSSVDICRNPPGDSWLLTSEDYARTTQSGFRWNEYECIALEATTDPLERAAITAFWDNHFPFMLAVHSDYDYLAVRRTADGFGTVVHGFSPEWESPSVVAPSFSTFLETFIVAASESEPEYPLNLFL
jgi:hypothetical protein